MFPRLVTPPERQSFFLFGPRGTGKSTWIRQRFPDAVYLDLLESDLYTSLLASPQRLADKIPPKHRGWVVIDEVQRVPELLNEVHRLIETQRLRFALTGSSARKLRRKGVNLLAGRARTLAMHPLTGRELGAAFDLRHSLRFGQMPAAYVQEEPARFLSSYVQTYLREEVQQEGLTRNLGAFSRFLETASFSQGQVLNVSAVARDCQVERKVVEDYFTILEDLLLAVRLPVFARKAKRKLATHRKFFFFDAGVYRAVRPRGPLDTADDIEGAALETLVFQELCALNDGLDLGYGLHYWRTPGDLEVDLVLYGERGLKAFEVKRTSRVRSEDLKGLRAFIEDYPMAEARLVYGGTRRDREGSIEIIPAVQFFKEVGEII
jgi:uncharacterized protein